MTSQPYLVRLTARLADGLARLPEAFRRRHTVYLRAAQNPDGGFSGREGDSDLYYTGFALRSLAVLGDLTPEVCVRTASYLRASLQQQTSVVDFFSLLYTCVLVELFGGEKVLDNVAPNWQGRVAETLETFRTTDGGYAKTPGGPAGSTYHSVSSLPVYFLSRYLRNAANCAASTASSDCALAKSISLFAFFNASSAACLAALAFSSSRSLPRTAVSDNTVTQ